MKPKTTEGKGIKESIFSERTMTFSKMRHLFFMLGNNQKEQLSNCDLCDSISSDVEKLIELKFLLDKCKSERNKKYVMDILEELFKHPTHH